MAMTTAPQHVTIATATIELSTVYGGPRTGMTTHRETRYDGQIEPDGGKPERCRHYRPGIGGSLVHPHETEAEALACARVLAGARYPGVPVREPRWTQPPDLLAHQPPASCVRDPR